MSSDIERSIRKWLDNMDAELASAPLDLTRCKSASSTLRGHVETLLDEHFRPISLSARLWSDAFLEQVKEDLRAVEILSDSKNPPPSVVAMLLQMVFEKLAKAALARIDTSSFIANRTSHAAGSRMVNVIKNQDAYLDLRYRWKDVLPLIQALERAHPAVSKPGPHLEYPWEAGEAMGLPTSHLSIVKQFADPFDTRGPRLIRFARELTDRFDSIFP